MARPVFRNRDLDIPTALQNSAPVYTIEELEGSPIYTHQEATTAHDDRLISSIPVHRILPITHQSLLQVNS